MESGIKGDEGKKSTRAVLSDTALLLASVSMVASLVQPLFRLKRSVPGLPIGSPTRPSASAVTGFEPLDESRLE